MDIDKNLLVELDEQIFVLTAPQPVLRRQGIRDVTKHRYEKTWHRRPLAKTWVPTIGAWGGIFSPESIRNVTKTTASAFHSVKHRYGLKAVKRESYPNQYELAFDAYGEWEERKARQEPEVIAQVLGIFPIELRIYVDFVSHIIVEAGLDLHDEDPIPKLEAVLAREWGPYDAAIQAVVSVYCR